MANPTSKKLALKQLETAHRSAGLTWPLQALAAYPRVLEGIEQTWGSESGAHYIDDLLLSDRAGRQGFSEDALGELVGIKQLHTYLYPDAGRDPWDPFQRRPVAPPTPAAAPAAGDTPEASATTGGRARSKSWPLIDSGEALARYQRARLNPQGEQAHRLIGQILVDYGHLTQAQIDKALIVQRRIHRPIGKLLCDNGEVDPGTLTAALCHQAGIAQVDLDRLHVPPDVRNRIPGPLTREYRFLPLSIHDGTLFAAVENPLEFPAREFLRFCSGMRVELVLCRREQLQQHLDAFSLGDSVQRGSKIQGAPAPGGANADDGDEEGHRHDINENDETVVGLVNRVLSAAIDAAASDVHIEGHPGERHTRIRFRRDGVMELFTEFPRSYQRAVVSRIKIMAQLDIAERRRPQDGKIVFLRAGKPRVDLRVSTIPGVRGAEYVTIRVLASGDPLPLDAIGMAPGLLEQIRGLASKPYGCFLVTGPTGSGKTTTLHSILSFLNDGDRKIWTAEDPVEIVQPRICQVQVNPRIGFTFASALRAFLRADPDVIMIGEMRDSDTAMIAVEASMTGHLVLSTLHTNSASEATARLIDLGVEPFLLSDALLGVVAQRLVRRLCRNCAESTEFSSEALDSLAQEWCLAGGLRRPTATQREAVKARWRQAYGEGTVVRRWHAVGCDTCHGSGFSGRIGIYELFEVTDTVRELIRRRASAREFADIAVGNQLATMKQDGIDKVVAGVTTLHELRGACN